MRRALVIAISVFGCVLALKLALTAAGRPGSTKRRKAPKAVAIVSDCLQPQRCSQPQSVRVLDLIMHANRYDRRVVRVAGQAIMLKLRKGACGEYHYFVLKDDAGRFVSVTDYTSSRLSIEQKRVSVVGFYRAELHNIDVCQEVPDGKQRRH